MNLPLCGSLASNAAHITPLAPFFQEGGSSNRGWGTPPGPSPKGLRPSGLPLSGNVPQGIRKMNLPLCGSLLQTRLISPPGRFLSGRGKQKRGWGTPPGPSPKGLRPSGLPLLGNAPQGIRKMNLPLCGSLLHLWELASNAARITPLAAFFQEGGSRKGAGGHPQGPRQRDYAPLDSSDSEPGHASVSPPPRRVRECPLPRLPARPSCRQRPPPL